jgi:hypothetical protein
VRHLQNLAKRGLIKITEPTKEAERRLIEVDNEVTRAICEIMRDRIVALADGLLFPTAPTSTDAERGSCRAVRHILPSRAHPVRSAPLSAQPPAQPLKCRRAYLRGDKLVFEPADMVA